MAQGGWNQGVYDIKNYKKYLSNEPPVFRSSWEYTLMYFLDHNEHISRWGSEFIKIPYISPKDGEYHQYVTDFYFEFTNKNGKFQRWIVEVKPESQLKPPKQTRKTRTFNGQMLEYQINVAKWKAAGEFCRRQGISFKIFTEADIRCIESGL